MLNGAAPKTGVVPFFEDSGMNECEKWEAALATEA